nr:cyclic nucleotide-binding domain-containing protein [Croceifilum oryzae]
MKLRMNLEQLNHYLHIHRLETVFNEQLIPHLSLYRFERGDFICSQGDASQYLYILVKGKVKVYTNTSKGKTLILSFRTPLDVIGGVEYVRGIDTVHTVTAVSPVCVIGVYYRWLEKYGKCHQPLLQFLLEHITQTLYNESYSLSLNLMYPVEVRLASYLISVSCDEYDLPYGQIKTSCLINAANLIGTSYRHVNRTIQRFCTDGLVERNIDGVFIKDREKLRVLAGHNIYEQTYSSI